MLRMFTAVAIGVLVLGGHRVVLSPGAQSIIQDDRDIIVAVLEHSIREEARHRPGPLLVLAQSIAFCERSSGVTCFSRERIERLRLAQLPASRGLFRLEGGQPGELMPEPAVRERLVASALTRNTERHPLPLTDVADIVVVPTADEADLTVRDRDTSRYAGFSLPGYSGEGHALVYAVYDCGGRCGWRWLFVLDRSEERWQVRARYLQGIR